MPGASLSAAEIAAAESVIVDVINPQTQVRAVWADSPDVAQAYLDQLLRSGTVDAALTTRVRAGIDLWRAGGRDPEAAALAGRLTVAAGTAQGADAGRLTALAGLLERRAGQGGG